MDLTASGNTKCHTRLFLSLLFLTPALTRQSAGDLTGIFHPACAACLDVSGPGSQVPFCDAISNKRVSTSLLKMLGKVGILQKFIQSIIIDN